MFAGSSKVKLLAAFLFITAGVLPREERSVQPSQLNATSGPLGPPYIVQGPRGGMVGTGHRDETVGMEPQGDRETGETLVHKDRLDQKDRLDHKVCKLSCKYEY